MSIAANKNFMQVHTEFEQQHFMSSFNFLVSYSTVIHARNISEKKHVYLNYIYFLPYLHN